ncbi:MAG: 4-(cytidine 5'-diphospho)-2-C-methyl-D-erythritol kinase [Pseudomonadota bacterium]
MREIAIKAPAKVNTILRVLSRRPDGYHDLEMVMVSLSLADDIDIALAPSGIELHAEGAHDSGMAGEKNLAWRAAALLAQASGTKAGARIRLVKRIPVAAGLGGGSSDAAAVLKGLNRLWQLGLDAEHLAALGAKLGADVPFFCHDGPAFVEGIGDRVSPLHGFPNLSILLINPGFAVSTPWVYGQWDLQRAPRATERPALNATEGLTPNERNARVRPLFKDLGAVVSSLHNDLEAVAIPAHPEIARIKDFLMDTGAAGALMSGSGPTVFGVFEDAPRRDAALGAAHGEGWRVFAADSGI